jgi:phosphoribosylanthranilate isomerase
VNASPTEITSIANQVPLDYIQLHGDESPETMAALHTLPIIRAWRVADQRSLDELFQYLDRCQQLGAQPAALLIDSYLAGQYGGTGESVPWELLVRRPGPLEHKSLILAGGLTPTNVSHAIHTVRPDGVDVASGVEQHPGRKSELLVRQFIDQAVAAFAAVTAG